MRDSSTPEQRGQHPRPTDPAMRKPYIHPTGGLTSHPPDDDADHADHAVEVMRELDGRVHVQRSYNGDPRQ